MQVSGEKLFRRSWLSLCQTEETTTNLKESTIEFEPFLLCLTPGHLKVFMSFVKFTLIELAQSPSWAWGFILSFIFFTHRIVME
jgi:hypothetical protein